LVDLFELFFGVVFMNKHFKTMKNPHNNKCYKCNWMWSEKT